MESMSSDSIVGPVVGGRPPQKSAYLVVHIEPATMQVKGTAVYSEPPWGMTRMFGKGRDIIAIVMETTAESYSEALDQIYESYAQYEPELAERFPLEPRTRDDSGIPLMAGMAVSTKDGLIWRAGCGHVELVTENYDEGDSEPCVHCEDEDCVATVVQGSMP